MSVHLTTQDAFKQRIVLSASLLSLSAWLFEYIMMAMGALLSGGIDLQNCPSDSCEHVPVYDYNGMVEGTNA